ncbi:MAG TPA: DUF2914 domain-containing protein [bacterium]|nr:DUF2914 domain-containing protein [bacterium]HPR87383.1 DUF2914 domain-containing protein [bacterium]
MARIIRIDRRRQLRLLLLFVLLIAAVWGLYALGTWLPGWLARAHPPAETGNAEPEAPDIAAVTTPAGIVHLKQALFCLDIHNRKPVVVKSAFNRRVDYIYCYAVLSAPPEGVTILHRWILKGQPVFERRLRIQGKNCRVWSRRHLLPKEPGAGRVEIVVEDGNLLGATVFTLL